jgi:hypothetical protein
MGPQWSQESTTENPMHTGNGGSPMPGQNANPDEKALTIVFPGSGMRWEDMAIMQNMAVTKPHNLGDKDADDHYFFFDGVGHHRDWEHPDNTSLHFDTSTPRMVRPGLKSLKTTFQFFSGAGMDSIADSAADLVKWAREEIGVNKIILVGFSRGGVIAIKAASRLAEAANETARHIEKANNNTLTNESRVEPFIEMIVVDPVAGFGHNKKKDIAKIPAVVSKFICGSAVNESLPGFNSRVVGSNDRYNTKIENEESTDFAMLPLPDDHASSNPWMTEVIKMMCGPKSALYHHNEDADVVHSKHERARNALILRLKDPRYYAQAGLEDEKSTTFQYYSNPDKYGPCADDYLQSCFEALTRLQGRTPHSSVQNDAYNGGGIKVQIKMRNRGNVRFIRKELDRFTIQKYFLNIHHEALFYKKFPNFYKLLTLMPADEQFTEEDRSNEATGLIETFIKDEAKHLPKAAGQLFFGKRKLTEADVRSHLRVNNYIGLLHEAVSNRNLATNKDSIDEICQLFGYANDVDANPESHVAKKPKDIPDSISDNLRRKMMRPAQNLTWPQRGKKVAERIGRWAKKKISWVEVSDSIDDFDECFSKLLLEQKKPGQLSDREISAESLEKLRGHFTVDDDAITAAGFPVIFSEQVKLAAWRLGAVISFRAGQPPNVDKGYAVQFKPMAIKTKALNSKMGVAFAAGFIPLDQDIFGRKGSVEIEKEKVDLFGKCHLTISLRELLKDAKDKKYEVTIIDNHIEFKVKTCDDNEAAHSNAILGVKFSIDLDNIINHPELTEEQKQQLLPWRTKVISSPTEYDLGSVFSNGTWNESSRGAIGLDAHYAVNYTLQGETASKPFMVLGKPPVTGDAGAYAISPPVEIIKTFCCQKFNMDSDDDDIDLMIMQQEFYHLLMNYSEIECDVSISEALCNFDELKKFREAMKLTGIVTPFEFFSLFAVYKGLSQSDVSVFVELLIKYGLEKNNPGEPLAFDDNIVHYYKGHTILTRNENELIQLYMTEGYLKQYFQPVHKGCDMKKWAVVVSQQIEFGQQDNIHPDILAAYNEFIESVDDNCKSWSDILDKDLGDSLESYLSIPGFLNQKPRQVAEVPIDHSYDDRKREHQKTIRMLILECRRQLISLTEDPVLAECRQELSKLNVNDGITVMRRFKAIQSKFLVSTKYIDLHHSQIEKYINLSHESGHVLLLADGQLEELQQVWSWLREVKSRVIFPMEKALNDVRESFIVSLDTDTTFFKKYVDAFNNEINEIEKVLSLEFEDELSDSFEAMQRIVDIEHYHGEYRSSLDSYYSFIKNEIKFLSVEESTLLEKIANIEEINRVNAGVNSGDVSENDVNTGAGSTIASENESLAEAKAEAEKIMGLVNFSGEQSEQLVRVKERLHIFSQILDGESSVRQKLDEQADNIAGLKSTSRQIILAEMDFNCVKHIISESELFFENNNKLHANSLSKIEQMIWLIPESLQNRHGEVWANYIITFDKLSEELETELDKLLAIGDVSHLSSEDGDAWAKLETARQAAILKYKKLIAKITFCKEYGESGVRNSPQPQRQPNYNLDVVLKLKNTALATLIIKNNWSFENILPTIIKELESWAIDRPAAAHVRERMKSIFAEADISEKDIYALSYRYTAVLGKSINVVLNENYNSFQSVSGWINNTLVDCASSGEEVRTPELSPEKVGEWKVKASAGNTFSHQDTIIRAFTKESYSGVRTQDFLDRGYLLLDVAIAYIKQNKGYSESGKLVAKLRLLQKLRVQFHQAVKSHCDIDINEMTITDPNDLSTADRVITPIDVENYLSPKLRQLTEFILPELVNQAVAITATTKEDVGSVFKELKQLEKEFIFYRGRPNIMHSYQSLSHEYLNAQRTVGQLTEVQLRRDTEWARIDGLNNIQFNVDDPHYTMPSTIRNREGIVNFVQTSFSAMQPDDKPLVLFKAYRHGSPIPIKVHSHEDSPLIDRAAHGVAKRRGNKSSSHKIKRQMMAMRCIKQLIEQIARDKISEGADISKPIDISIASLSLLSDTCAAKPFVNRAEFEGDMIKEVRLALKFYDHQKVRVMVDGKQVWTQVDTMFVTAGTNMIKSLPSGDNVSQEDRTNREGFYRFTQHIAEHVKKLSPDNLLFSESAKKLVTGFDKMINSVQLTTLKVKLIDKQKELCIYDEYIKLRILGRAYEKISTSQSPNKKDLADIVFQYNATLDTINTKELELDNLYKEIFNQQSKDWSSNRKDFKANLGVLEESEVPLDAAHAQLRDMARLFYDTQKLYYDRHTTGVKKYASGDFYFEFHKRYLLLASQVGLTPDFFCKSGEDRTGRLDNMVQEMLIHRQEFGQFAAVNNGEQNNVIKYTISRTVHECSASRENTRWNSDAVGLQVDPYQGSDHLAIGVTDKVLAKTAKGAFSHFNLSTAKSLHRAYDKELNKFRIPNISATFTPKLGVMKAVKYCLKAPLKFIVNTGAYFINAFKKHRWKCAAAASVVVAAAEISGPGTGLAALMALKQGAVISTLVAKGMAGSAITATASDLYTKLFRSKKGPDSDLSGDEISIADSPCSFFTGSPGSVSSDDEVSDMESVSDDGSESDPAISYRLLGGYESDHSDNSVEAQVNINSL